MHRLVAFTLAIALVGGALAVAEDGPSRPDRSVSKMAGGTPIPAGAHEIHFPWMGKQSLLCIGEAFERQVAIVDFSEEPTKPEGVKVPERLGIARLAADGTGSASFTVPAALLRTGDDKRDGYLWGGAWLSADDHPELSFTTTKMTRLAPTVWRLEGSWKMRGIEQPASFLANVQYLEEMAYLGKRIVRVKGSFDIDLKKHGILNPSVGTPAVPVVWKVDLVMLGLIAKTEGTDAK